jgi:hypothetical protein
MRSVTETCDLRLVIEMCEAVEERLCARPGLALQLSVIS